jgi:DNA repair exonuclease SbcCD nuclease subunit
VVIRILAAADLHLGRRSARLPDHLAGPAHSAGAAFDRLVDAALASQVDLVALAGDLIDRDNRYFEAFGPLERGLTRLAEAGVDTVAVSGNHDWDLLPEFARRLRSDRFYLLGQGGRWENRRFERNGSTLDVLGWSYPAARVFDNPAAALKRTPSPGTATLGLLHTGLDQPGSPYAPTALADLTGRDLDLWLIGHAHKPAWHPGPPGASVINPGSVQALDPGEPGTHGARLIRLEPGRPPDVTVLPLSTIRYETMDVSLDQVTDPEHLRGAVIDRLRRGLTECAAEAGPLSLVSFRVRLTGRTPLYRRAAELAREPVDELTLEHQGVQAVVERVEAEARPAVDLEALAHGTGPPAILARLLIDLDHDRGEAGAVASRVLQRLSALHHAPAYHRLADLPEPDLDQAKGLIRRQGLELLEALLAQKEDRAP